MAMQHVNLYANKRHLRSEAMRKKGVRIHPIRSGPSISVQRTAVATSDVNGVLLTFG